MPIRAAQIRLYRTLAQAILLALAIAASCATSASAQDAGEHKRVLVVLNNDSFTATQAMIERALRSTLKNGSPVPVETYSEYVGNTRAGTDYEKEFVGLLQRKYEGKKFDVIFTIGQFPTRILLRNRAELFPGTPIVFIAVDERLVADLYPAPDLTGVWGEINLKSNLELALALHPGTRRVVVIQGVSQTDKDWADRAQEDFRAYQSSLEFIYLTGLTTAEMRQALGGLPPNTIVFFVSSVRDKAGNTYESPDYLRQVSPGSTAPIYATTEAHLGTGIVGGKLLSFEALGNEGGRVGLRVLAGEKPGAIAPHGVENAAMFDWRALKHWGINEDRLPPGSVVRFKEPSFWELYKWYIIAVIALIIIESSLITWLLIVQRRRRIAERERERFAGLVEAEHRHLEEVVSNVPGIVWETRIDPVTNERVLTFISDYVEKVVGYTAAECLSSGPHLGLRLIADEEERKGAARIINQVISSGKGAITEHRWQEKGGRHVWVETHLSPMVDEQGKVVGLRGVSLDITGEKLAEIARRRSEERNRAILQAIPDIMFLQTRDGTYLDCNAKDPKELYLPPEEFLGKNVREVMPPELAEKFLDCLRLVDESGEPQVIEYTLMMEGQERCYEARIVRSSEDFLSIVRDITERKRAEAALRDAMAVSEQNRAQLDSVFQTVSDGIMVSDMQGNLLLVNEAMSRIHEYENADAMKRNISYFAPLYELFHPDGRLVPYDEWPMSKVLRGESVTDWELRIRSTDTGREWFCSYSGEPVRDERGEQVLALLVTQDITERKASEEALRQSEARFRNMADTAPVMIWVAGTDKLCTYFNKQWLDFTGRSLAEELGNGWAQGVHPDDSERCLNTYLAAFDRREPFTMEYRRHRADGLFSWVYDTGTPRFSSTGEFLGFIGSCVDITDRKESEAALQMALEEVNQLKNQLQEENIYLREEIKLEHNFSEIIGHSDAIKYVLHKIEQVAPTHSTVLIMGETGTGKELVARAIHSESPRRARPLVKVNCAVLSASLIESELFGHEKGAFTGASSRKIGRFELADGATIFLDEIGELPPELQVKLLRVIQEGEFERLGSARTIKVDVRIIAATNRNLWDEVQKGLFREDLFYRLNVFPITVPPLRQRVEDISLLVEHFVTKFSKQMGKKITSVVPVTLNALRNYPWPGNVRELANVIERAVINNSGPVLHISNISETLQAEAPAVSNKTLEEIEREYINTILGHTGWKIEGPHGAAQLLGLHPSTLRTRMAKLKIQKPQSNLA